MGGGIGGLTLALALRRRGLSATIYEQADELREVGAAVALSANATRFYDELGLRQQFDDVCFSISTLIYRDGRSGVIIGKHSGEPTYEEQFGACYWGIHRADLQAILSQAVGLENIHLSKRLTDLEDSGKEVVLRFEDGSSANADLVIGADGARSFVRQWMLGYDDALYSGCSGFRGIVTPDQLDLLPDPDAIQFWVGPGRHLLHYPIGNGDHNFLLVERNPSPWPSRDWRMPAAQGEQLPGFEDWHPAVVQMISAVPTSDRWALFHRPPLGRWTKGRVTLIGDAAHALVPHHGQRANQSIEDAVVLADKLADGGMKDMGDALEAYEKLRRGRTRKVQFASITTADILHLPDGPAADMRNARLANRAEVLRHLGWIHAFDPATQIPTDKQGGTWL
ncbi:MAG: FAD-dependent monooxygenase [Magnetospiraceae bacterium]